MKPLIYVAGPYTNPDPVLNVRRACHVADQLVAAGAAVIVPHLSMLWHLISPAGLEEWYERDLDMLAHCHAIVRFYGESSGADREWNKAAHLGLKGWWMRTSADEIPVTIAPWIERWKWEAT